jgi:hypothetical protein
MAARRERIARAATEYANARRAWLRAGSRLTALKDGGAIAADLARERADVTSAFAAMQAAAQRLDEARTPRRIRR